MSLYSDLRDDELVRLLNKGNDHAYTEIYHRYHGLLYIHAYKRLRNRDEALDIVHELFASLWSKRAGLSVNNSLAAYLYTAIRNRILDVIAHEKVASVYIQSIQHFIIHRIG